MLLLCCGLGAIVVVTSGPTQQELPPAPVARLETPAPTESPSPSSPPAPTAEASPVSPGTASTEAAPPPPPVKPKPRVVPPTKPTNVEPPPNDNGGGVPAVFYQNCTAARAAGAAPILRGEPGYRPALDRDNDGIACET